MKMHVVQMAVTEQKLLLMNFQDYKPLISTFRLQDPEEKTVPKEFT
jgi:hypothetical protein